MSSVAQTWAIFMPYVLYLGVFRVITGLVWLGFTRGRLSE